LLCAQVPVLVLSGPLDVPTGPVEFPVLRSGSVLFRAASVRMRFIVSSFA